MYKVDCFLDNYYVFDNNYVYVVKINSTIGKEIGRNSKDGAIDKSKWSRLYEFEKNSIDVMDISDYELFLKETKENIIHNEKSIKRVKKNEIKKVNRVKSQNIKKEKIYETERINRRDNKNQKFEELFQRIKFLAFGAVLAVTGAKAVSSLIENYKNNKDDYVIEKNIDNNNDSNNINIDNNYDTQIMEGKKEEENTSDNLNDNNVYRSDEKNDDVMDFYYDEYDVSEKSAKNVMQYIDLCKKYGDMYGEDYRLLAATLAQELNGKHVVEFDTSAVGAAQLEKEVWGNTYISAYNVESKYVDGKWIIFPNIEDTIDNEEFNKRPKSGDIIGEYGKNKCLNVEKVEDNIHARAMIDANYREQAYKNGATKKIPKGDFVPYTKARENKGPSVWKTLEYGDEWKYHLDVTNNGDDNYVNEVFTYADMISDFCNDHSPYVTKVYDSNNDKIVTFTLNAFSQNKIAKTK